MAQSGRSMVEMLGTLAIIGVLSIGGIAGYSYGMDKWRANETINDVNLRMIDIMTHVSQGRNVLEISPEFEDAGRSGYVIDVFQNTDSEPSIMVEKVPSSVCKMILQNSADTQDIYVGVLNGNQVDGNWYLGNNEDICENGDKEMLFALDESILGALGQDNGNNYNPEATITVTPKLECYSNADCRPEKPYCNNGTCVECTQDSQCKADLPYCDTTNSVCHECESNADCDANQYCADKNRSCYNANPSECKDLDFRTVDIDGTTYYISNSTMNWWDATSACEALGKSLLSVSDLVTGWSSGSGIYAKTALAEELYSKVWNSSGYPRIWSSNLYNSLSNSCYAYYVHLGNGNVVNYARYNFLYAVCR